MERTFQAEGPAEAKAQVWTKPRACGANGRSARLPLGKLGGRQEGGRYRCLQKGRWRQIT